jgi:hypothetical protein
MRARGITQGSDHRIGPPEEFAFRLASALGHSCSCVSPFRRPGTAAALARSRLASDLAHRALSLDHQPGSEGAPILTIMEFHGWRPKYSSTHSCENDGRCGQLLLLAPPATAMRGGESSAARYRLRIECSSRFTSSAEQGHAFFVACVCAHAMHISGYWMSLPSVLLIDHSNLDKATASFLLERYSNLHALCNDFMLVQ